MSEKIFFDKLLDLINDNTSGSSEILEKLNKLFIEYYKSINFTAELFLKLKESFSSFESILNYLTNLENLVKQNNRNNILVFFKEFDSAKNNIYNQIFKNLKPYLKNDIKIITISNSTTVLEIIKRIHNLYRVKNVIISESRPQFEGRILAEKLLNEKIFIHLITEAQIPEYVKNSDICLVGADSILANRNVVNKIGSKVLALSCKYYNKPFYIIADSSKFSKNKTFNQSKKPTSEIWENHPKGIKLQNIYFEEIEKELITKIITEKQNNFST